MLCAVTFTVAVRTPCGVPFGKGSIMGSLENINALLTLLNSLGGAPSAGVGGLGLGQLLTGLFGG
ncbi:hypothetical protein GCM10009722_03320 [Williamsia deligens]|nr:hypothetical protein [Williamsia deligens]